MRRGIEEHLADAGFRFFFVDAHLARAGRPLGLSGDPAALDPEVHHPAARRDWPSRPALALPGLPGRAHRGAGDVSRLRARSRARRCRSGAGSRAIPGDGVYLEFHKMRWPGGLKLWRVSGPSVDLGAKEPYDPGQALDRARGHADHFAGLLGGIAAAEAGRRDGVIVAPFDTELFGHWWFEGPDFLGDVYRALRGRRGRAARPPARGTCAGIRRARPSGCPPAPGAPTATSRCGSASRRPGPGSGSGRWRSGSGTRPRPRSASEQTRFILAQAARELLLAQSSDWQFIISTGAAADYGERRFREHCSDTEELVARAGRRLAEALERGAAAAPRSCAERDALFPDVLPAIAAALGGSRSLVVG